MTIGFVFRSKGFASKFEQDTAILSDVLSRVSDETSVCVLTPENLHLELGHKPASLSGICSMGRERFVLDFLSACKCMNLPVINDPDSVRRVASRAVMLAELVRHQIPIPQTEIAFTTRLNMSPPFFLKGAGSDFRRRQVFSQPIWSSEDLTLSSSAQGLKIFQKLIPSALEVKAYVIGDDVFLKVLSTTNFGVDTDRASLNGKQAQAIEEISIKCGTVLGLDIYNVDILETANHYFVVDVNDFPSFSGVPDASIKIADYVLQKLGK